MKVYALSVEEINQCREEDVVALLDLERRQQLHKMKKNEDRLRGIGAGLLLRYAFIMEGHTVEQWNQIQIGKEKYGKPYFPQYEKNCFSISHSGDWVVCCMDSQPVGIDIQKKKDCKLQVAKRFFATQEYQGILEADGQKQRDIFYEIWTAKESYVKYTGTGLQIGLDQIICNRQDGLVYDKKEEQYGAITYLDFEKEYTVCICVKNREGKLQKEITKVKVPEIMEGYYA